MIEPAVRMLLANNATVAAVVPDRVWLGSRPQDERRPGIVLTLIDRVNHQVVDGHGGYSTGLIQADCLAPTYQQAKELAAKARDAVDGYSGIVAGTNIDWLMVEDESDIPAMPLEGKATPTFGVALEISFMIQR